MLNLSYQKKTIQNEVDKKRVKICAIHERVKTTIVTESMTHL